MRRIVLVTLALGLLAAPAAAPTRWRGSSAP